MRARSPARRVGATALAMAALRHARAAPARRHLHPPRAPGDPRPSLRGVLERLGAAPKIPEDLRHRHVLRHTFATRYYRQTRYLTGLQRWLGQRQSEDDDGLR